MVRLAGIEPTTPWFVAKYSIQLSYSRQDSNYIHKIRPKKKTHKKMKKEAQRAPDSQRSYPLKPASSKTE